MARKEIPLYDISHLSGFNQKDIQISRFAPYLDSHKNLQLPHKHSFYHLILFTEGGGKHTIDFTRFTVRPYQIYFMIPGQVHSWEFEGRVDGFVVNFSPGFFQSFLLKPDYLDLFPFFSADTAGSVIDLPEEVHPEITDLFNRLLGETETLLPFAGDMIRVRLLELFYMIGRLRMPGQENRARSHKMALLKNFQHSIEHHFLTLRMPKDYAELLYVTPNHLNALCRDLLGIPAGEVIRNRVVLEAKRQLVNLDLSISEIAYKLNFEDNSYFSKFFRKQSGMTPEQFRQETVENIRPEKARPT